MLKKLEIMYDEDGDPEDIEDKKIYWDTTKNQFRHKFECCECETPMECRCYDSLSEALSGIEDGMICEKCGMAQALSEVGVDDLIYRFDEVRTAQVDKYLDSLITEDEILEYKIETDAEDIERANKFEIIEGDEREGKLKDFVISLMTEDEKRDEFYETCDEWAEGESCNI